MHPLICAEFDGTENPAGCDRIAFGSVAITELFNVARGEEEARRESRRP